MALYSNAPTLEPESIESTQRWPETASTPHGKAEEDDENTINIVQVNSNLLDQEAPKGLFEHSH